VARRAGTILVGDVSNTLAACPALAASDVSATVFYEQIGFNPPDVDSAVRAARSRVDAVAASPNLRIELAAHAPYSVSPALMRALAAAGTGPFSIHLGESAEELRFLRDGGGAWRSLLERVGAWSPDWAPPDATPVEYLDRLGLVNARLLAVHGVQLTRPDLERLAGAGATVVACPRSNAWTGAGDPPVGAFYAAGVRVAVGTDSLASVEDLNLFSELAAMRRLALDVPAAALLASATLAGATALGWEGEFGSIEPGKRAALLSVRLPGLSGASAADVEECLVNGVAPGQVRWLPASESRAQNPELRPQCRP
jgi:cytosine/adenosine deaminase-related metal-dependent hydrolase